MKNDLEFSASNGTVENKIISPPSHLFPIPHIKRSTLTPDLFLLLFPTTYNLCLWASGMHGFHRWTDLATYNSIINGHGRPHSVIRPPSVFLSNPSHTCLFSLVTLEPLFSSVTALNSSRIKSRSTMSPSRTYPIPLVLLRLFQKPYSELLGSALATGGHISTPGRMFALASDRRT